MTVRHSNSISADFIEDTIKTIRATLAPALFKQFGTYFGLFGIVRETYPYIVSKFKIYLYSLRNSSEYLTKDSLFYLLLKLVKINFISPDNARVLSI